ncbi:MAG: PAS domain-containing protein [Pseudomonadota bacterium]|nr:PAS domain-containing protein [Pseudomonadota bacterium]
MFAAFILLCGLTHVMEIWTVWNPAYRLSGALKLVTGIVSLATTVTLVRLTPLALKLRSPRALQREVEARTADLAEANATLRRTIEELEVQREKLEITHREKNEAQALLGTTLRSVGDAVISTDADGVVQFMNAIAESLTGWTESEAKGRTLDEVFRIVNEESRAAVESPVAKVLREGTIVGLANYTILIARDQIERPIEDSGAPIMEGEKMVGVVLVFRDATAQRADQRALVESQRRYREAADEFTGLADNVNQLVWMAKPDGGIFWYNRRWYEYTGTTPETMQGWGWQAVHDPNELPTVLERWRHSIATQTPLDMVFPLKGADGEFRPFLTRVVPIKSESGQVTRWFGTNTDISELRRAEAALREANARKDVFLATLSHELRNPLAPIRNAATLLAKPALSHEDHERSRLIILRQVRHMASLLDDLLDMSRITRGVFRLKKEVVNLEGLLAEALETARPLIDHKRHTLKLKWPSEPIKVEADPIRLVQIATNLLTNAAKYTDPEGVITFEVRTTSADIVLLVRDTGIGLPSHMLTEVFEMFSQVAPEQNRSEGGLGIGLALVKGLVELHGGRIEARSAGPERGSEFFVLFPGLRVTSGGAQEVLSTQSDTTVTHPIRRVLIADDNVDGAESLAMLIESSGHEVYLAHTGVDALQMAATHRPHIAILDIGMPGMDGYQVAQKIRDQAWGTNMILVALTGWGQEDDKRRAQRAGFDHHLTKPVDPAAIDALITASAGT